MKKYTLLWKQPLQTISSKSHTQQEYFNLFSFLTKRCFSQNFKAFRFGHQWNGIILFFFGFGKGSGYEFEEWKATSIWLSIGIGLVGWLSSHGLAGKKIVNETTENSWCRGSIKFSSSQLYALSRPLSDEQALPDSHFKQPDISQLTICVILFHFPYLSIPFPSFLFYLSHCLSNH